MERIRNLFKQNIYCQASSRHQVAFTKVMIIGVEDKVHFTRHKFVLESTGSKTLKRWYNKLYTTTSYKFCGY